MKAYKAISTAIRLGIWRLGRKLYLYGRRDIANWPESNGEYWLLEEVIKRSVGPVVYFDVGANKGDWTARACALLAEFEKDGTVWAFEPTLSTNQYLAQRFQSSGHVKTFRIALSDKSEIKKFYVVGDLSGVNTLSNTPGSRVENVQSMTVDDFLKQENLNSIKLLKSDTEGFDLNVLIGGVNLLATGRVEVWQFEYNHRWISQRCFLRDVFTLISDKPYILGKLYADGIECYAEWHPELERFFEANYVLVKKGSEMEAFCTMVKFNQTNVPTPLDYETHVEN